MLGISGRGSGSFQVGLQCFLILRVSPPKQPPEITGVHFQPEPLSAAPVSLLGWAPKKKTFFSSSQNAPLSKMLVLVSKISSKGFWLAGILGVATAVTLMLG
eukprot:scaffold75477_cov23-Tisochrysis_lutea.AAC.2